MKMKAIATAIAVIQLMGCSTAIVEPIRKNVEADRTRADQYLANVQAPKIDPAASRTNDIWLPVKASKIDAVAESRPAAFASKISINRDFHSIYEVAERITLLTGIPAYVSPDVTASQGGAGPQGMPQGAPLPAGSPSMLPLPGPGMTGGVNMLASNSPVSLASISYNGTVTGFLDTVAARYGVSWSYSDGRISFFKTETRTFVLNGIPGDSTLQTRITNNGQTSVSGGTGSGSSGTQSNNETSVSAQSLSIWKAMEDSIRSMLSAVGKVSVSPAIGTVTVTDIPMVVSRVEQLIKQQNISLSKQVLVNVEVLSVALNANDEYGINWGMVYQSLSKNFGWSFANAFQTNPSAGSLTLKILPTAGQATNSNIQAWQGSQAIISALSMQGDVSIVTSATALTLNNQPVPIQVGTQTAYLASSSTTNTPNVGSTTSLTPGVVSTGFSMTMLPHILENGQLMMQYAIDISDLVSISQITSGGSSIQTPIIDTRNFLQRVSMRSGETLVLAGFERIENNSATQGVGNANNVNAGGGVRGKRVRNMLVILVRPVISSI